MCKILDEEEVKPHKVRYYLERRDSEFAEKSPPPHHLSDTAGGWADFRGGCLLACVNKGGWHRGAHVHTPARAITLDTCIAVHVLSHSAP